MPIYKLNGKTYNIPDDKASKFEAKYPGATVSVSGGGKSYDIPLDKKDKFFKKFEDASYAGYENDSATKSQNTVEAGSAQNMVAAGSEQNMVAAGNAKNEGSTAPANKAVQYDTANVYWPEIAKPAGDAAGTVAQEQKKYDKEKKEPANYVELPKDDEGTAHEAVNPYTSILETERVQNEDGTWTRKPKMVTGANGLSVYRDLAGNEYNPMDAETMAMVERDTQDVKPNVQRAKREQVERLGEEIDQAFETYNKEHVSALSYGTYYGQAAGINPATQNDPEWLAYSAAKFKMDDAKKLIAEADKALADGTFENTFLAGAARGFGEKFFDVRTWANNTDAANNKVLLDALTAFDNGEELTQAQKMLLDATTVELATQAYFGSYIGRGYKAGQVTAESLPFMLEMCINPASAAGKGAESAMVRYALKRFGKTAIKDASKRYVAAKVTTRVLGDVVGSAVMAGTTGIGNVAADAMDRMAGDVQFDTDEATGESVFAGHTEGDDVATAIGKAFAATTIENYSEMVGTYFEPLIGVAGNVASKGLEKIGLGGVNDFIENVAMSDVAKLVGDFEKHSQWNGTIGEYAEEVVGGILNALVVGDQTLDTAEGTGVFNLDNNIDTFLGVALMGGVMSAVKTVGYRTPKYRAKKAMAQADEMAAETFADPEEWGGLRNTIAFGSDEEVKEALYNVVTSPDYTQEQRAGVLEYAKRAQEYKGMMRGEQKRRSEEESGAQVDAETSFDNGYQLSTPQEMNDARNNMERQQQKALSALGVDNVSALSGEVVSNDDGTYTYNADPVMALTEIQNSENYTEEQKQVALDYLNAKATYDGMIERVRDDIDSKVFASDQNIDKNTSKTQPGSIVPATMKMNDRQVYVIDGDVKMMDDGTMVDTANSSESVLVRDGETGKLEFVSPHDILRVDSAIDAEAEKEKARQEITQSVAQETSDVIDGKLSFNVGDKYDLLFDDGRHTVEIIADNEDGTVTVTIDNSYTHVLLKEDLQQRSDAESMARLEEHEQKMQSERSVTDAVSDETVEGGVPLAGARTYKLDDEVTLRDDDGYPVRGTVIADLNNDGKVEVMTERPIGGNRINQFTPEEMDGRVTEINGENVPVVGTSSTQSMNTSGVDDTDNSPADTAPADDVAHGDAEEALDLMPMVGEGENAEPDFMAATPERGAQYLIDESGLSGEDSLAFAQANVTEAEKEAERLRKNKPKVGTNLGKYKRDLAEWEQKINDADARAEQWKNIHGQLSGAAEEQRRVADEQLRAAEEQRRIAEAERQEQERQAAIADEAAYRAEQERLASEQQQRGAGAVSQEIKDKWASAKKVEGAKDQMTLPNGRVITGTHYLVEADAVTASHDGRNGFQPTVGFPVDEKGQNVNTRDYYRDADAQSYTRNAAADYDERGMGVVVSKDAGVAYSGNGRTIAGQMAAQDGTDGKYNEYLTKFGQKYGYTPEQVAEFEHPRDVFVPDEELPYTAETFDMFNQEEMKSQSKTEEGGSGEDGAGGGGLQGGNEGVGGPSAAKPQNTTGVAADNSAPGALNTGQGAKNGVDEDTKEPEEVLADIAAKHPGQVMIEPNGEVLDGDGYVLNYDGGTTFYHGTNAKSVRSVKDLKTGMKRADGDSARFNGDGISFTPHLDVAQDYGDDAENGHVLTAKIRLRKPAYTHGVVFGDGKLADEAKQFSEALKSLGYDGIINLDTPFKSTVVELIVFDAESAEDVEAEIEAEPIGSGFFGNIYDQFKGRVNEAFKFLMAHKSGDLLGVFRREDIGDIDLVWGDEKKGFKHIIDEHVNVTNPDFKNAEDAINKIEDIINNGTIVKEGDGKATIEKDGYKVVVSKNIEGEKKNWVLTAFDSTNGKGKKKEKPTSSTSTVTPNADKGGRAVTSEAGVSVGKGSNIIAKDQEKGQKNAPDAPNSPVSEGEGGNNTLIDKDELDFLDGMREGRKMEFMEECVFAYNSAFVETTMVHFGDSDEGVVKMSFEKFREKYVDQNGEYLTKDVDKYLRAAYDYISRKLNAMSGYVATAEERAAGVSSEITTKSQKSEGEENDGNIVRGDGYTIEDSSYTNKKGKTTPMKLVKFASLTKEQKKAAGVMARGMKGWWSEKDGGFLMRSMEDAEKLTKSVLNDAEKVADAQPAALADVTEAVADGGGSSTKSKNTLEGDAAADAPAADAPFKKGQVVFYLNYMMEVKDVNSDGTLQLGGNAEAMGVGMMNVSPDEVRAPGSDASIVFYRGEMRKKISQQGMNKKIASKVVAEFEKQMDAIKEKWNGVENINAIDAENMARLIGFRKAVMEVIEGPERVVKEYHAGEKVWSKKHRENKTVFVANHDGEGRLTYYVFADGTKALAVDVEDAHEEKPAEDDAKAKEKKALELVKSMSDGDVLVGNGFTARIELMKDNYVRVHVTKKVENGQDARYTKLLGAVEFLNWCEANGMKKQEPAGEAAGAVAHVEKSAEKAEEPTENADKQNGQTDMPTDKQQNKKTEPVRLVSDARMEELKARLRKKLGGQMNVGIDPEVLAIGTELAVGYIERGVTKFADYAKVMIDDLGDLIRPYCKSFYNAVRDMPEAEEYADDMDSYDEVRKFDMANFMKPGNVGAMEVAEMVVNEQKAESDTEKVLQDAVDKRNENRHETEKQIEAATEAVASAAEAVAGEAQRVAETGGAEQLNEQLSLIDEELDKVTGQLALLGYYEADTSDPKKYHEQYWYMKTAEKKAVADANNLAKAIADDLGVKLKKKNVAKGNVAPAGGDVTFNIPLSDTRILYVDIMLEPDGNNLKFTSCMFRVENPYDTGERRYVSGNEHFYPEDSKDVVLSAIRRLASRYIGQAEMAEKTGDNVVKKPNVRENGVSSRQETDAEGDLFGEFFGDDSATRSQNTERGNLGTTTEILTNNNNENNGTTRQELESAGNGVRTEGLPTEGNNQGEQTEVLGGENREEVRGSNRGGQEERGEGLGSGLQQSVRLDGQLSTESETEQPMTAAEEGRQQRTEAEKQHPAAEQKKNTGNNHAARGKDYAPKGVDARIEANIRAIELMKQLMESGKKATQAQMKVLRQFSGWGGLGKAFNERNGWERNPIYTQLRELLGDEAFEQANMSRNSAYYTPAVVIDTLWDVARAMGFKGGRVLEGSAGIGNIIGAMPTDMSERSDIEAVEIDETTGNILSLLYPEAKVHVQGFEATKVQNGSVDLAITNVPFVTGLRVNDTTGDKDLSRKFHDIHDFCIAKNIRKLKEGGIGIFITSSGTMDNSQALRNWIVNEGDSDVVGVFRMHNETFGGTGATSDIIVVRRRVGGRKSAHAIDVSTVGSERVATYEWEERKNAWSKPEKKEKTVTMDYNKYFMDHPEMMAGKMEFGFEHDDTFRPTSKALYPAKGKNQDKMLAEFVKAFDGKTWDNDGSAEKAQNTGAAGMAQNTGSAGVYDELGEGVKEGSMVIDSRGRVCIAMYGKATPIDVPTTKDGKEKKVKGHTRKECFEAYAAIKKAIADVLDYQSKNDDEEGLKPLLAKLNKAYDDFVATYGNLNKNTAIAFLRKDIDFPNVAALEKVKESNDSEGNRVTDFEKTDIFEKRVLNNEKEPEPKDVKDGIIASMYQYGRVDLGYIAEKVGKSVDEVKAEIIEKGLGYVNPLTAQMEVSYMYLSGNVREKLRVAKEMNENGEYDANIAALEKAMPVNIPAHLISYTLGSSWIDKKLFEDYVLDRTGVKVRLTAADGTWLMTTESAPGEKDRSFGVHSAVFNSDIYGHQLIEAALRNTQITVSRTHKNADGTQETETDKEATLACSNKVDEIRQDFKDWAAQKVQTDEALAKQMEETFNEKFNNYVPMTIGKEYVPEHFPGQNPKFSMRPHQGSAIVRAMMQPVLLAHEVGTGKTYTQISIAMEMRRLGLAKKPMIAVQNATVGQFVASAKELYPNAKILSMDDSDHSEEGRRRFYAKIKYNDWDIIVVPQSVLDRMPDSEERQMQFVRDKIEEKMHSIEAMRNNGGNGVESAIRQAEKEIEDLQNELTNISSAMAEKSKSKSKGKKRDTKKEAVTKQNAEVKAMEMLDRTTDDVENFDDMGIDALLVDEAHEYKHLGFATAMQRGVKGIDPSYSKKAQGVFLKVQAVMEKNNGKNVVFATGTPISNTAAEIWTFMRYLMPAEKMKEYDIYYFDDFVRNFGRLEAKGEFSTSGAFKENNRFRGYINLPELVRIWSSVADTMLTEDAEGVSDKIPQMESDKAIDIYLPQSPALRRVMKFVKSQLYAYEAMTGKEKRENSHIPLTMYGIAKAAAIDPRLVDSAAEDYPMSKTNETVRQTIKALKESEEYKGTVALFVDSYQNKRSGFNLYDDIREKLIREGVPAEQVVIIRSGLTDKKKLEIFDKVNSGEIRVVLGSTATLGTGVNIQERLFMLAHIDAPNRPMDYTQRNGRILRQGNLHNQWGKPVRVLRFGVEDSLDVTAYQRLKTKGAIADSIMRGKKMMEDPMNNREMEEEDDVFGDAVAQLSGSEYALLKNQAEKDVRKWRSRRGQWEADQRYISRNIPRYEKLIKESIEDAQDEREYAAKMREGFSAVDPKLEIHVGNSTYVDVDAMDKYLKDFNKRMADDEKELRDSFMSEKKSRKVKVKIGAFTFDVLQELEKETAAVDGKPKTVIHSYISYSCPELGIKDQYVSGRYLKGAIEEIVSLAKNGEQRAMRRAEDAEREAEKLRGELEQLKSRLGQKFQYEKELEEAEKHLEEYTELMVKELEAKEAKYKAMDANVTSAVNLNEANIDEGNEEAESDDDKRFRMADVPETDENDKDLRYSLREQMPPKRVRTAYAVFIVKKHKDGSVSLHPKMIEGDEVGAPPLTWLNADTGVIKKDANGEPIKNTKGRVSVRDSHGAPLAWRPGKHLAGYPNASQFAVQGDTKGVRDRLPDDVIFFEVEYAADEDYQSQAWEYGVNANGKYEHSQAGLPYIPKDGFYVYRTNANPNVPAMIITGAYRIKRALTDEEAKKLNEAAGGKWLERKSGKPMTEESLAALGLDEEGLQNMAEEFDYEAMSPAYDESAVATAMPGYVRRELNFEDPNLRKAIEENEGITGRDVDYYKYMYEQEKANDRQREATVFEEGERIQIEYSNNEYRVEGLSMPFWSADQALNAFREKYQGYVARMASDGRSIIVNSWRKVLEDLRGKKRGGVSVNGSSTRSKNTGAADEGYVSRKTRNAIDMVEATAKKLGLNVEVKTDTEGLSGRRARAKGWYDTKTGKIVIILPNHTDGTDVMRTVLHEGVGHYGLRELFGEDFDTFLDNVYANADEEIRKRISAIAAKNGWDFRVATEEYLASVAEDMDFTNGRYQSWWQKVKFMFLDMLRKAGLVLDRRLTDNDLRYILWRSHEHLNKRAESGIEAAARAEMMQIELGVGNYNNTVADETDGPDDDNDPSPSGGGGRRGGHSTRSNDTLLYRDGDVMDDRDRAIVTGHYEREIASSMYQFREAMQDSMLSLRRFMEMVSKETGREVKDYENAYMAENALSSKNHAEQEVYGRMLFEPMLNEVHNLAKQGSSRDEVVRYMMAKHGLERQAYMEARAEQQAIDDGKSAPDPRDYAGLTGLMGTNTMTKLTEAERLSIAMREASDLVAGFESAHDTDGLWARVNACTKATLEKAYKSGLISKEAYEKISTMYEWYIPLRGFDETTSEEVYSYLSHESSGVSSPVKHAEGRSSMADDPLATIANMADSAIVQGNKNMVKQKFLKFVMNNPTDLVTVSKMWLRHNDVTDEWEAVTADLDDDDTPDEILAKTEAFEEQMQQLAEADPDKYKRGRDAMHLPYRALNGTLNEHQIHIKMGGQDYVLTVNGNPRLAQAINGMTNPNNDMTGAVGAIMKLGEWVNRQLSAFYTTRNPEFVASNFLRDMEYSTMSVAVKESKSYAARFTKNVAMNNPAKLVMLINKYNAGTLDMTDEVERAFQQFMINGGETGYTAIKDIRARKAEVKKYLNGKMPVVRFWDFLTEKLDIANRSAENCARFAAFLTSRQEGRTIERSVMDAKEVSVNFNKKGAGSKFLGKTGQTFIGNVGAFTSGLGRTLYVFWNAAVQGTTNFGRLHKRNLGKALAGDAYLFVLGALMAYIGYGGDDDDEPESGEDLENSGNGKYSNVPTYVRRSNICFKIPGTKTFASYPLGIEHRAIYGLGELAYSAASGNERMTSAEIAKEVAVAMSSLMPVDMLEGSGELSASALTPSYVKPIVECYTNKDWKGMPVYKDTPWNKDDPEWTKASTRTNKYLVEASEALNEWTGGDDVKKGRIDVNPAKIEHVLEGTFGGVTTTVNKLAKMAETVAGKQDFDWRNMLILSRLVKGAGPEEEARRVNKYYWKYYNEYKETKRLVDYYEEQANEGNEKYMEKLDAMINSEAYERFLLIGEMLPDIKAMTDDLKEVTDSEERRFMEMELNEAKKELIQVVWDYEDSMKN